MLLDVRNLSISFRTPRGRFLAAENVSFQIPERHCFGLVGESGSGKSVSALSILQLLPKPAAQIESGQILFEGQNLIGLSNAELQKVRGRKISMIFQEPMTSLNPVMTVGDQIDEVILLHKNISQTEARRRTLECLDLVSVSKDRVDFYPHQLSGGMRQRVMIAMALACDPKLLIADEPTTALDVTIQKQILELLKKLQKDLNLSLLLISHDLGIVSEMADSMAVMYAGRILESGPAQSTLKNPSHVYTKALELSIPHGKKRGTRLYSLPFVVPGIEDTAARSRLTERWKVLDENLKNWTPAPIPPTHPENSLLQIKNLSVEYSLGSSWFQQTKKFRAVNDVSFEIRKGETVGLVGESGCGKSTIAKAVTRLIRSASGDIHFQNQNLLALRGEDLRAARRHLQLVFQDPFGSLNPRMRIGQILEEPLKIHNLVPARDRRKEALRLLSIVGLAEDSYDRFPHEFSGGQRQRIGIARALAVKPEFIVADEPVSALDVSIQASILNLLNELKREFQLTYLFISHDLNLVQYLCDRILVMKDGQIVQEFRPEDLKSPDFKRHEYTQRLLDAIPVPLF